MKDIGAVGGYRDIMHVTVDHLLENLIADGVLIRVSEYGQVGIGSSLASALHDALKKSQLSQRPTTEGIGVWPMESNPVYRQTYRMRLSRPMITQLMLRPICSICGTRMYIDREGYLVACYHKSASILPRRIYTEGE